jgi:glutamine amidotransferase
MVAARCQLDAIILMEELLFKMDHGLIDQSLHARMGLETRTAMGSGWGGTARAAGVRVATGASRRRGAT